MAYAEVQDVFDLGLPAQAFATRPRPFEAVDISTGRIRLTAHGLTGDDLVELVAVSGGSLPGGASALTQYHPVVIGADLFSLQGITSFSSPGAGWAIAVDPKRRLQKHLDDTAAVIDEHLTAHDPPIQRDPETGKYPTVLIGINARMAAREDVTSLQMDNAAFRVATDRLFERKKQDLVLLKDWKGGKPIQPRPTDEDTIADNAAHATSDREPVGWQTGTL